MSFSFLFSNNDPIDHIGRTHKKKNYTRRFG